MSLFEQPPIDIDPELFRYLISVVSDIKIEIGKTHKFPERKEMPVKAETGDVHYFGNPATHNYDAVIVTEGFWGKTNSGWKKLG